MLATSLELAEHLLRREPLFDRPEIVWDGASFDEEVAPDFREIGASGQVYRRDEVRAVVLGRLVGTHPTSLPGGYRLVDPEVRALTDELVQVTYTLHAQDRVTQRSTLHRRTARGWQAVFHQGTVVIGAEPLAPVQPEPSGDRP